MRLLWASALAACLVAPAAGAAAGPATPPPSGPLAAILEKFPAADAAAGRAAVAELVKLGPRGVADLAALVVEPGAADDWRARQALHGVALYVSRPGAEAERLMVCEALRGLLAGPAPTAVKGFFLQQLRIAGCPKAVPAVSGFLLDDELCEYAAQTLVTIGGGEAAAALLAARPKSHGKCRLTIVQNLGVLRYAPAAADLAKAAADPDREVRMAALRALANIGDPAAWETLHKAAAAESAYERAVATDAALLLAQRLAETQRPREAEEVYRALLAGAKARGERHIVGAALRGLAALLGAAAADDLVQAMKDGDPQVRAAAMDAAALLPGDAVTAAWLAVMPSLEPQARGEVLAMLVRRGGSAATAAVIAAMGEREEAARLAGIRAAAESSDGKAAEALIGMLSSPNDKEKQAARRSLERMPGQRATAAVAQAILDGPSTGAKELVSVLVTRGARNHVDALLAAADGRFGPDVAAEAYAALENLAEEKHAASLLLLLSLPDSPAGPERALAAMGTRAKDKDAYADMIIQAMDFRTVTRVRAALVRVLGRTGGDKALAAVRPAVKDSRPQVQDAAVRSLADWPDAAAAPDLLELARSAAKPAHQVLALRGYVRLAGAMTERPEAERLAMYAAALAAARRPDEKRLVLGALGDMKSADALQMVVPLLADEALREEAAAAAVKIARGLGADSREAVRAAMKKVLAAAQTEATRRDAEEVLRSM